MTFSAMTHRAMICQKKFCESTVSQGHPWSSWNEKIAAISSFEDYVREKFSGINPSSTSLEQYTQAVAGGSLVNIKLMLRRPPYRNKHCEIPPWDDFDVMRTTTDILERSLNKHAKAEFAPWAWFAWVKWYALAVLLAELCGPGSSSATDHAYLVAQQTSAQYAPVIADSESGMLWRPIAKLMSRVDRLRGGEVPGVADTPSQSIHFTAGRGLSQSSAPNFSDRQSPGALLPDILDPTIANTDYKMYGLVDQQKSTESALEEDLSYINWDMFLQDMANASNMDWGQNRESNNYDAST